jgi:hypothetical protein
LRPSYSKSSAAPHSIFWTSQRRGCTPPTLLG